MTILQKDWLTAAEISSLKLRGLPQTKRGVANVIEREGWDDRGDKFARKTNGKGGGFEYSLENLPAAARHDLAIKRHKAAIPEGVEVMTPATVPDDFSQHQTIRRDARLELLAIFKVFHVKCGLAQRSAEFEFARSYNANAVEIPSWVRAELKSVSAASLQRWRALRNKGQLHDLGGKYGHAKKSVLARANNGDVANFIGALIIKQPHLTADHITDIIESEFGSDLVVGDGELAALPPIRTFQRFIADWKAEHKTALTKITNPDRFKSSIKFAGEKMNSHVVRLNQLWEIDASPVDVLTKDGRRNLYCVVDIFSRRMLVQTTDTPRTQAMLSLMRRAIKEWGVPEIVRIDNGSDFTSYEAKRAFNSLEIQLDITHAFSPEEKGTVERHIKTLQHGLMPLLPGFVGHNVADRKVIEERKAFSARLGKDDASTFTVDLTAADLQNYVDRWVQDKYQHKSHKGICDETPFNQAASFVGTIKRIGNDRALDLLLMPIAGKNGHRTVTKFGIRLDNGHFISAALDPGQEVFIRHDPEDMGRIYCFEKDDGAFIAEAICPDRLGVDPKEAIIAVRREQARRIAEEVKPLRRAIAKIKPRDLIDGVLATAAKKNGNLSAFPKRSEEDYQPIDLAAAIDATRDENTTTKLTDEEKQAANDARARIGQQGNVVAIRNEGSGSAPIIDDDLKFWNWAHEHPGQLNDVQREFLRELKDSRSFQRRLKIAAGQ
ncbi:MAG: transposase [Rhizobiaceae bacterium]